MNQTFIDNDQQLPLITLTLVHFVLVSIHSDGGFIYLAGQQSRQQEANPYCLHLSFIVYQSGRLVYAISNVYIAHNCH